MTEAYWRKRKLNSNFTLQKQKSNSCLVNCQTQDAMEFSDSGGKLDVSDVELMELLVGYHDGDSNERVLHQPHPQQQLQQQYQEISYSNNNATTFSTSGEQQQQPPVPMTNFNVTWTVQVGPAATTGATTGNASVDVADTDDERVVERWEPGEIISEDDEEDDEDADRGEEILKKQEF